MRIQLCTILLAVWLTCASGARPRPAIVVQKETLLMVMTSAELALRNVESRDESHTASFNSATVTVTKEGDTELKAVLNFGPAVNVSEKLKISSCELTLIFKKEVGGGYWGMTNSTISLEGTETQKAFKFDNAHLISGIDLYAPDHLSFHCSRFGPLYPSDLKSNHTFLVYLKGFQIHPFTGNTTAFGGSYECVGFFSIGILSGIFVTLILMAILAWGLAMIIDVKTMDRFDDPKGKPISFGGPD